jgi:hypothetical protein
MRGWPCVGVAIDAGSAAAHSGSGPWRPSVGSKGQVLGRAIVAHWAEEPHLAYFDQRGCRRTERRRPAAGHDMGLEKEKGTVVLVRYGVRSRTNHY